MTFDGVIEAGAITARLKTIPGVSVYDSIPDDDSLERYSDGTVKPYVVTLYNVPYTFTKTRQLAVGEEAQPYLFAGTVEGTAGDGTTAFRLGGKILTTLMGFMPNGNAASAIKCPRNYNTIRRDEQSVPTRWSRGVYFETIINLDANPG